jgi:hypothetical protein
MGASNLQNIQSTFNFQTPTYHRPNLRRRVSTRLTLSTTRVSTQRQLRLLHLHPVILIRSPRSSGMAWGGIPGCGRIETRKPRQMAFCFRSKWLFARSVRYAVVLRMIYSSLVATRSYEFTNHDSGSADQTTNVFIGEELHPHAA